MLTVSTLGRLATNVDDVNTYMRACPHGAEIGPNKKETRPAIPPWKFARCPHRCRPEVDRQERRSGPHAEGDRRPPGCVAHGGLPSLFKQGRSAGGDPGSGFFRVC